MKILILNVNTHLMSCIYGVRKIEKSLGSYERKLSKEELNSRKMIRRSIVAKKNITNLKDIFLCAIAIIT